MVRLPQPSGVGRTTSSDLPPAARWPPAVLDGGPVPAEVTVA